MGLKEADFLGDRISSLQSKCLLASPPAWSDRLRSDPPARPGWLGSCSYIGIFN